MHVQDAPLYTIVLDSNRLLRVITVYQYIETECCNSLNVTDQPNCLPQVLKRLEEPNSPEGSEISGPRDPPSSESSS